MKQGIVLVEAPCLEEEGGRQRNNDLGVGYVLSAVEDQATKDYTRRNSVFTFQAGQQGSSELFLFSFDPVGLWAV